MLKEIEIGEIIKIKGKEYIIVNTPHKNGRMKWEQPTLIKLDTIIKNINRKPYFKKRGFEEPPLKKIKKGFKGIKLTK